MALSFIFQFGSVLFAGLFTGAMGVIAVALMPFWRALPPSAYRESFQALGPYLGSVMVPLMGFSIAFLAVTSVLSAQDRSLWMAALVLVIAIIPLYAIVHAPLNDMLLGKETLSFEAMAAARSKWSAWHWVRTGLGSAAFLLSIAAFRSSPVGS